MYAYVFLTTFCHMFVHGLSITVADRQNTTYLQFLAEATRF